MGAGPYIVFRNIISVITLVEFAAIPIAGWVIDLLLILLWIFFPGIFYRLIWFLFVIATIAVLIFFIVFGGVYHLITF